MPRPYLLALALCVTVPAGPARAQQPSDSPSATDVAALRDEVRQLRAELAGLRAEVARLGAAPTAAPAPAAAPVAGPGELPPPVAVQEPVTADALPAAQPAAAGTASGTGLRTAADFAAAVGLLQAAVEEQAQTKVESSSRLPLKLFGTIHASLFANSGEANWLDLPNTVLARVPGEPAGSFSASLRQTRLGVSLDGLAAVGARWHGLVAMDFFGGVPAVQTGPVMGLPRLLYAFARGEWERTSLEVGHDEMVFAPRNPTSLAAFASPALVRSGNLYLRVPQVRLERRTGAGAGADLVVTGAIVAPVSGDFTTTLYTFAPPALAGERSRWPAAQGRVAWRSRPDTGALAWDVGVSGHYGREKTASAERDVEAWAADGEVRLGRVAVAGEWFTGDNLDAFSGAVGQPRRARGGFGEVRLEAWSRLDLVAGGGTDRVRDARAAGALLASNLTWFGGATVRLTPELSTGLEYRWLETRPTAGGVRRNQHVDWVVAVSF